MPEFPELRQSLSQFYFLAASYEYSLQTLAGVGNKVVLQCAFPQARLQVVGSAQALPELREVERAWLEPGQAHMAAPQTIWIASPAQAREPVLHIEGLRPDEVQHLADELQVLTAKDLAEACAHLPPAYALPLLAIHIPPRTSCWRAVIKELTPWLQSAMAYLEIAPDGSVDEGNLLGYNLLYEPVLRVVVEPERAHAAFSARLLDRSELPVRVR
jgi:hypothetical protein